MILLITGTIFLLCGVLLFKFPPKRINSAIGFRTPTAMKNKDTWDEAQKYGALSMAILGVISLAIGGVFYFLQGSSYNETLQLLIFLLGAVIMIIADEIHLIRIFNKDGSRKSN